MWQHGVTRRGVLAPLESLLRQLELVQIVLVLGARLVQLLALALELPRELVDGALGLGAAGLESVERFRPRSFILQLRLDALHQGQGG